ncbi:MULTISPECIES: iron ABC transporter permease [Paracoccus]|uniref:iron ABC transporter permease n=1 Tax=Paracoccus TaxID=265 RepID=UPI000CEC4BB8|nr:iron ABC transporter permease [Paracoccus denitrificans]
MSSRALDGRRVLRLPGGMQIGLANLAAALALTLASLGLGAVSLSWGETRLDLLAPLDADQAFALYQVRLPRLLLGFMAGWSVALAGAMLQSLARNPLADPGLLGLSQGAMVAIMVLTVLAPGLPPAWLPGAALLGGLAVAALLLALVRGHAGGLAVLLMGIALESTLSAVTAVLVLYTPPETSHALAGWMAGSLALADWPRVTMLAPWFAASPIAILLLGRALRLIDLGTPMAMALGLDAALARVAVLIVAVLLSSAALTAVGPLMFLGVMAPQLAAALSPASGRARLVLAALTGGLLVTAADMLARNAGTDIGLPVGLVLVTLGAPLFVLAMRMRLFLRMSSS